MDAMLIFILQSERSTVERDAQDHHGLWYSKFNPVLGGCFDVEVTLLPVIFDWSWVKWGIVTSVFAPGAVEVVGFYVDPVQKPRKVKDL